MPNADCYTFSNKSDAEQFFYNLPDGYNARLFQAEESRRWMVSFRKAVRNA